MATALAEELLDTPVGKIQLMRGGSGDPLVYLHSAAGEVTLPVLEDLADGHAVTVPVFPGFGRSEGLERIDGMEDAVFHLLDVLDILGLRAPAVMGLSLGGWMAAELATRAPERVGRLVLVNPVGLHIEGAPVAQLFGRTPAELAEDTFADQSHPMAQMMHNLSSWVGDPTKMNELPLELLMPMVQSMAATAKLGWNPYLHNPKLSERLRRVKAPTLVIAGAADRFLPRAHCEAYVAGIPGARLEVVEGAGHMAPLERPGEVTALVSAFLAGG
ncbi:MAG TPA: alpha/beta hydrolase [Acidimicrobiia bacterium]|nr:alpha/beta hydrolase [Acidimicrobiia bacterium]